MDNYYRMENGWDVAPFSLQDSKLIEYGGIYQGGVPDSNFNLDDALAEYMTELANASPTALRLQSPTKQDQQVIEDSSSNNKRYDRRAMYLEKIPAKQRNLRCPSPDSIERRRMQNRVSQNAFRERNRKMVEGLRQELSLSAKYNQHLYQTMRDLLGKTELLKAAIEQALASNPPNKLESLLRSSAEYHGWTPSGSQGPAPDVGIANT